MSDLTSKEQSSTAGKSRTWWHPLFVNVLSHELARVYDVLGEVQVGIMPLRLDVVLLRRARGRLTAEIRRELATLATILNRYTFIELKAPTDRLEHGDLLNRSATIIEELVAAGHGGVLQCASRIKKLDRRIPEIALTRGTLGRSLARRDP
jgi:hypothetical protein